MTSASQWLARFRQGGTYHEFFLETLKVIIIAGVTVFLVRYFLFKPFYVKGESMEPNFYENEYLIIDELSYRFREPARGEVVVFNYQSVQKDHFLKRIIGLPGERVKVADGKVTVYNEAHPEGVVLDETYLPDNLETYGERTVTLGPDEFFVLGDNRIKSLDSRRFGAIVRGQIIGRVLVRGWPLSRAQKFTDPLYTF